MDINREAHVLAQSLEASMDELLPDYLLRWMDCVPGDWPVNSLEDILRAFLGYATIAHVGVDIENAELLEAADYWQQANEDGIGCQVEDGDVVLVDQDKDEEIFRAPLPDWLLKIDGVIEFMRLGRDRQICAGELCEVLSYLWFYMFNREGDDGAE